MGQNSANLDRHPTLFHCSSPQNPTAEIPVDSNSPTQKLLEDPWLRRLKPVVASTAVEDVCCRFRLRSSEAAAPALHNSAPAADINMGPPLTPSLRTVSSLDSNVGTGTPHTPNVFRGFGALTDARILKDLVLKIRHTSVHPLHRQKTRQHGEKHSPHTRLYHLVS